MQINMRDAAAGVIFLVIAALFALGTQELTIGTALRMGPGYFPLVLAGVLGVIGFITLFKAVGKAQSPMTGVPWRGLLLILGAPVVFGLTLRGLGLVPTTAITVAIAAFASRRATLLMAASLTVGLTIFCVVVFSYGLGLPVARFGPWLPF